MIGRDTGGGGSFVGAGLYYLHDKNADTDERIAFTHTENLLTDNAETAMKVMAWTAKHQAELKAAAGVKATGRKLEKPVHTFMLSWAPGEQPDHEHMIVTARSAAEALGLADHEAVFIGHDDTDKAHVHIIVNRVHPENGKAATLSKSRLALSKWAESYERENGIHCHRRIENNERRAKGDRVIDLESRRRNAEQFSDWREKRALGAARSEEQRRFNEWAERKRHDLTRSCAIAEARLAASQKVRQASKAEQMKRTYGASLQRAGLGDVERELAVQGLRGLWRRLSGRRKRLEERQEQLTHEIEIIAQRRAEALTAYRQRQEAERREQARQFEQKRRGLEDRIANAKARREKEGWRSAKMTRTRPVAERAARLEQVYPSGRRPHDGSLGPSP